MNKRKILRGRTANYCFIVAAVGLFSCKNPTDPGIASQRKDLVGCWELNRIDGANGFGHKIQFNDPDSAHFHSEAVLFQDESSSTIESKINVSFEKWKIQLDSIILESGNGTQVLTYPDSTLKIDEIKILRLGFFFSLDSGGLNLRGKWPNGEPHSYKYSECGK